MSVLVKGKTFDLQTVSAADDAQWRWNRERVSRVTRGCTVSNSGLSFSVTAGYIEIHGRQLKINSTTTLTLEATSSNVRGYLCATVDLSQTNTDQDCNQSYLELVTAVGSYPSLIQNDLDANLSGKYQFPLVKFIQGAGGVTSWEDVRNTSRELTANVSSSGWTLSGTHYYQTISVAGINSYDTIHINDIKKLSSYTDAQWQSALEGFTTFLSTGWVTVSDGSITLYCLEQPTASFTAILEV